MLHEMGLHEVLQPNTTRSIEIIRVNGGWLYNMFDYMPSENAWLLTTTTFVPFHNEFQEDGK